MDGREGNDQMNGGSGNNDAVIGADGNDILTGGLGTGDLALGGFGTDTCDAEIEVDCEA